MDELSIPSDLSEMTPSSMIADLETLAVKAETDGLTDAEAVYQASLRQRITERVKRAEADA